jgi:hypothetical protein
MKHFILASVLFCTLCTQAQKTKPVLGKPVSTTKKPVLVKPVAKQKESPVALPPKPRVFTKAELIETALLNAGERMYKWNLFNDGFGFYNTGACDGPDSLYVEPFNDTTTTYIVNSYNLNGVTKYRFYMQMDTATKKVTDILLRNYGSYYVQATKTNEVGEKDLYSYKLNYNGAEQDSIIQFDNFKKPAYVYRIKKDSTANQVHKIQFDNGRLWATIWMNKTMEAADSIQYYVYSSFTPYTPEPRTRDYLIYDSAKKLKQFIVAWQGNTGYLRYSYIAFLFDYNEKDRLHKRRIYNSLNVKNPKATPVAIYNYEYNDKNLLTKQVYYAFNAPEAYNYPTEIPATSIPTTITYIYNDNGLMVQSLDFYEDNCVTRKDITDYELSHQKYIKVQNKKPNIVTRCRY